VTGVTVHGELRHQRWGGDLYDWNRR